MSDFSKLYQQLTEITDYIKSLYPSGLAPNCSEPLQLIRSWALLQPKFCSADALVKRNK